MEALTIQKDSSLSKANELLNAILSGRKKTTIMAYRQDLIHFAQY